MEPAGVNALYYVAGALLAITGAGLVAGTLALTTGEEWLWQLLPERWR